MKRIFLFLLPFIAFTTTLRAQCPSYPQNWSKRLTSSSYTWAFDGNVNEAKYTNNSQISVNPWNLRFKTLLLIGSRLSECQRSLR